MNEICMLYDDKEHRFTRDVEQKLAAQTVFVCNCGVIKIEAEDAAL